MSSETVYIPAVMEQTVTLVNSEGESRPSSLVAYKIEDGNVRPVSYPEPQQDEVVMVEFNRNFFAFDDRAVLGKETAHAAISGGEK